MAENKQVVVVAGSGNIAQYLAEEFVKDKTHDVIIISRSDPEFFRNLNVPLHKLEGYSKEAVVSILDRVNATVLVSTLHTDDPRAFTSLHETLLEACKGSKSCNRFIPSEFLGNLRDFPTLPRGIQRARQAFRKTLAAQSDVKWTLVNQGWLADYFVQVPDGSKSYVRPFPEGWPIDLQEKTVRVVGTGDEPVGWTAARDVSKAVVKLVSFDDWDDHTYVFGELGTWNQAIDKVERFWGVELKRTYVTKEDLEKDLTRGVEDARWYTATIDEWSGFGGTAVPREEALRQREKYFKDVHFRTIEELLLDSRTMQII
ncbi:hypothetical protein BHE90_000919 [Fusarium euwallaceae]|uniref:NAD(P)-binding domain-containing protein n=1 Tax=Fusarium euwallaceae TaxID=1147111 RepID=A0A430M968_9HYPO|nr:hypothetical protein BHE90_000919 [Fusarium euwallaceae]